MEIKTGTRTDSELEYLGAKTSLRLVGSFVTALCAVPAAIISVFAFKAAEEISAATTPAETVAAIVRTALIGAGDLVAMVLPVAAIAVTVAPFPRPDQTIER